LPVHVLNVPELPNYLAVIPEPGMQALDRYFSRGGKLIGIHSASCMMPNSDFFVKKIGAAFDYHPDFCHAVVQVADRTHPSTSVLPERWEVEDEM
jgi:hypothetical protein